MIFVIFKHYPISGFLCDRVPTRFAAKTKRSRQRRFRRRRRRQKRFNDSAEHRHPTTAGSILKLFVNQKFVPIHTYSGLFDPHSCSNRSNGSPILQGRAPDRMLQTCYFTVGPLQRYVVNSNIICTSLINSNIIYFH